MINARVSIDISGRRQLKRDSRLDTFTGAAFLNHFHVLFKSRGYRYFIFGIFHRSISASNRCLCA